MNKLKVFESFSGIGTQVIGLRDLDISYEVVGTSEVDKYAILAYNAIHKKKHIKHEELSDEEMIGYLKKINVGYNFVTNKNELPKQHDEIVKLYECCIENRNYGDIRKIDASTLPDFDMFTYSFPCKNITNEGNKTGFDKDSGTQSSLVWNCESIIDVKRPKILLMENVKNILAKRNISNFTEWCELLESYGYVNYYKIYNAKKYGLPQNRERVMMVSLHKESGYNFDIPNEVDLEVKLSDLLEKEVDEKYFLNPEDSSFNGLIKVDYTKTPIMAKVRVANIKGYDEAFVGDTINYTYVNSKTRRGRVGHGVAQTLTTACLQCTLLPDGRIRNLTPLEYWRIQGLSDEDFYNAKNIAGLPETKLYERAGRAIPICILTSIYKNLFFKEIEIAKKIN